MEGTSGSKPKVNKTLMVLEHLKSRKTITSIGAIDLYGATRLSDIIFNLRRKGYDIETVMIPFTDKYGNASKYGKYILHR